VPRGLCPVGLDARGAFGRWLAGQFQALPRGIDTARFTPDKRSRDWRARYGIGDNELVVLHVSRLVREKRLDT